jgi:hypothetical protein
LLSHAVGRREIAPSHLAAELLHDTIDGRHTQIGPKQGGLKVVQQCRIGCTAQHAIQLASDRFSRFGQSGA